MKKIVVFSLIFCLLMPFFGIFASASSVEVPEPTDATEGTTLPGNDTGSGIDAVMPLLGSAQVTENAKSVFLYEISSDTLMYAWNPDLQMFPSSFVKILTALIAIEKGNLTDVITVKESVLSTVSYDAVSADLQPDEQLTLEALLYCMMVGSANDAAAVIADYISGSQEAFVEEMNVTAKALGCTNSQFKNPHGLHHEEQLTTARDMARILSVALKNETFRTIFSTIRYSIPATNKHEIRDLATGNFLMNTDEMEIYFDSRVTGGRTGVAQDGTRCLAVSAKGNGLDLISIVMGAEDVVQEDGYTTTIYGGYKETTQLLDLGLTDYKAVIVLCENQPVNQCDVLDGTNQVVLGSQVSVSAVIPANVGLDDLSFRYTDYGEIRAPIAMGDALSKVEVWYGNTRVAAADLYAMNSVNSVTQMQAIANQENGSDTAKVILIILGVVVTVAVLGLVVIRILPNLRRFLKKRRMKRYRRSRRRSR